MLHLTEITNCYLTKKYVPKRLKCLKLGKTGRPDELTLEHTVYGGEVHKIIRGNYQMYEGRPGYSFFQKTRKGSSTGQQLLKDYILPPLCCHRFFKLSFCSNRKTGVPTSIANHLLKEYFLHRCHLCYSRDFHQPPVRWRAALPMSISH